MKQGIFYEINVIRNGLHVFATDSVYRNYSESEVLDLLKLFKVVFPKEQKYRVNVYANEIKLKEVAPDQIKDYDDDIYIGLHATVRNNKDHNGYTALDVDVNVNKSRFCKFDFAKFLQCLENQFTIKERSFQDTKFSIFNFYKRIKYFAFETLNLLCFNTKNKDNRHSFFFCVVKKSAVSVSDAINKELAYWL